MDHLLHQLRLHIAQMDLHEAQERLRSKLLIQAEAEITALEKEVKMLREKLEQPEPEPEPGDAKYLTRKELALRWKCSMMTLRRKMRAGKLPFSKMGRTVRIAMVDVLRIEAEGRVA